VDIVLEALEALALLSRRTLAVEPLVILPSSTREPAMMPSFGILIGVSTSARPSQTCTKVGS
jgi:hypothetical protein